MSREHPPLYILLLLRLWLDNDEPRGQLASGLPEWRASLEDPYTQQMQVFPDLEALFDFLLRETERLASGEDTRLEAEDVT